MRFNRFTRPQLLKGIGREMLGKFFGRFNTELTARKIVLPASALDDDAYYTALAAVALAPDGLPDELCEALFAIEGLANAAGQEQLELAVMQARLAMEFPQGATHGDIAVQVYLAHPALFTAMHNQARLARLVSFEYFSCKSGNTEKQKAEIEKPGALSRKQGADVKDHGELLAALTADMDAWFKEHQRGHETTRIEVHPLDGEWMFIVRHGDTFARTAKVEARRLEIMHFRPAKEDVVVYCPKRDEIRVHAGTKGEKELYRRAFGRRLFGDEDYFSERKTYTLEPLREDCAEALDAKGLPGVREIVLREVELAWGRNKEEFMVRGGTDIFGSARTRGRDAIPEYGTVMRAVFDFYFAGEKKPRRVEVRTPNTVKVGRGCDARVVHEWLSARGFRVNTSEAQSAERGVRNGEAVAV